MKRSDSSTVLGIRHVGSPGIVKQSEQRRPALTRWRARNLRWLRRFFSWMRFRRISSCSASVISRPSDRACTWLRVESQQSNVSQCTVFRLMRGRIALFCPRQQT